MVENEESEIHSKNRARVKHRLESYSSFFLFIMAYPDEQAHYVVLIRFFGPIQSSVAPSLHTRCLGGLEMRF